MRNINIYFKEISSVLIVGVFIFLAYGSDESKTDNESNINADCSNKKGAYTSGYASGSLCRTMGDYSSCESFVQKYNYETGRNILVASDCYCEGFNDGKDGNPKKYGSDTEVTNTDNNYSSSNDYVDKSNETQTVNHEYDSTDSIEDVNDMSSNIKSADELEVADKKLNDIYKQVMAVLNETEKTKLRHEQRKWIKYRDISCEEETKDMNGSLYNAFLNNCEKEKTEKRIEELNEILQSKE